MVRYLYSRRERNADIRRLYAINILRGCNFYLPVIVPYYADVAGVDFSGFMLGEVIFAMGMVLLEVPTGYLSDIWQRRVTMIVSALFWVLGTAYMLIAKGLLDIIIVQLLMAVGASLLSGTIQAMLYEYLAEEGREADFRRCEGKRFAYGFYALALSSLPVGLMYAYNQYLPVVLGTISQIFMLILSFRLREPVRARRAAEKSVLRDVLETMRYALYGHREIAAVILLASFMMAGTKLIMWAQQPYYMAAGIPVEWYGALSFTAFLIVGVNGQLAHMLERWIKPVNLLGLLLLAETGLALLAGGYVWFVFAPLLLLGQAMYGVANPVIADVISQRAEPERRATILSAQSLAYQLMFSILSVPYGMISEDAGVGYALVALAAILLLGGGPAWLLLRLAFKGQLRRDIKVAVTQP